MGIIQRVSNLFKAKANNLMDNLENPMEQMELAIQEKKDAISKAIRESAELVGSVQTHKNARKELVDEIGKYKASVSKAKNELNDEDLALKYLAKVKEKEAELARLDEAIASTEESAERIKASINKLQDDVKMLESEKTTLKAEYSTAKAESRVNEILAGIDKTSVNMDNVRAKVRKEQAYASGLSEMAKGDGLEDPDAFLKKTANVDLKDELKNY